MKTGYHDLHWLDVTGRIQFRVAATATLHYQCLHSKRSGLPLLFVLYLQRTHYLFAMASFLVKYFSSVMIKLLRTRRCPTGHMMTLSDYSYIKHELRCHSLVLGRLISCVCKTSGERRNCFCGNDARMTSVVKNFDHS